MSRRAWPLLVLLALTAVVGLGSAAPAPAAEAARVLMVDNEPDLTRWHYEPAEVTVPAGSTVVWFNKGKEEHSVTADDKSFDSGLKKSGASWQRTFSTPGTYTYYCAPHPWMKGAVRVVAAGRTATEAAVPTSVPATAAPAPPATAPPATDTTFAPPPTQPPEETPNETAAPAPVATTAPPSAGSGDATAAPASARRSGGHLARTIAVVVLPTLAALALGARLRRSRP